MRSFCGQEGSASIKMGEKLLPQGVCTVLDQKEPRWRNCEEIAMNYEEHTELASPNADLRYGTAKTYWC